MSGAEITITGLAVGGDGVAREASGRVLFVPGGLPGDRLRVRITEARRRFARAEVVAVLSPGDQRVVPPCPEVARGCGGCGWQHLAVAAQRAAKRRLVTDALVRIGRLGQEPDGCSGRLSRGLEVIDGPALPTAGYRTSLRCAVVDGRAGFRRPRSPRALSVEGCLVAHPRLDELLHDGRFPGVRELTLRCGARSGDRLVVASPSAAGVRVPADVQVLERGQPGWFSELVAGRRWRISAGSFFQSRPDGADLLVERVAALLAPTAERPGPRRVLDAYCGVGLLSAAAPEAEIVAVEVVPSAVADARVNLADRDATVVEAPVERWQPQPVDAVIADPARRGLGAAAAGVLAATGAAVIVLVSCDAGSLGRDAGILRGLGYQLDRCELLDLFPHTPHVEVVSRFVRG